MPQARPLLLAILLLASGLAALAPAASAASAASVGRLGIADETGAPGLVGHSAVYANGATYIFGGRLSDNTYSDKVYRLDHATNATSVVASLPAVLPSNAGGRYSGAAMLLGSKVYYAGGAVLVMVDINGDGTPDPVPQSSSDVFEFDTATHELRVFPEKLPRSAWGMAAVAVSPTKGYLFGGFTFSVDPSKGVDASRRDWVVEIDLSRTGAAERKIREMNTALPYPLQDAAAARLGDTVYVFGGLGNNDNSTNPCGPYVNQNGQEDRYPLCQTRNIIPFFVGQGVVRPDLMKEMPYRAQFISAAALGGKVYVPGGILPDGTAASSVLEFDPAAPTPVRVLTPTLPRGTFGAGVVTDGASVFVLGGRTGTERQLTDDVVRIDVAPTAPWAPRGAVATGIPGGLRLAWEPPAYDGDSPVSLYRVYRSSPTEPDALLKETAVLALDDLTVKPGIAYVYRISALNAVGESNATARVSVNAGVTPPGPVRDFQAYAGDGEALLRWSPPANLGGANLSGYRVLRDDQIIATLPPSRTEHRDTGLANGGSYGYSVRAYNEKGNGEPSPLLRVNPAAVPPSPTDVNAQPADDAVSVTWLPPSGAWDAFTVYRSLVPGARGAPVATNLTAAQFVDSAVEKGRTYHYQVASVNRAGESPPSEPASVSLVRQPGPPTQVQALSLEGEVRVTWQPPTDAGDAPVDELRYYVTRSSPGGAPRIVASDIKALVYVDRTLQPGTTYEYSVTTLNPLAGAASPTVSALAKAAVNKPPVAVANVLPPVAALGEAVTVDASPSEDPDGVIRGYVFDFGDGTDPIQTGSASVTHVYDRNGTYQIKVIVTDDRNEDAFVTASVVVGEIADTGASAGDDLTGRRPLPNATDRPGTKTPAVPGPGPLALLAVAGLAALVLARRRGA